MRLAGAAQTGPASACDQRELAVKRPAEQQPPAGGDPQLLGRGRELSELVEAQRMQVRQGSQT